MKYLIAWIINAVALYVTVKLVPGINVDSTQTLLLSALVIGIINSFLKPILQIISLPLTILTLGLFTLVINATMLSLAARIVPNFQIADFRAAFIGAIVISIVSTILHSFIHPVSIPRL
jgi:putative membrane protein